MKIKFLSFDWKEEGSEIVSGIAMAVSQVSEDGAFVVQVPDSGGDSVDAIVSSEFLTARQAQGLLNQFASDEDWNACGDEKVHDVNPPYPEADRWQPSWHEPLQEPKPRDYPVWKTPNGGLVREVNRTYIFIENPDPGFNVGDEVPSDLRLQLKPANKLARKALLAVVRV